MKVTEIMTPSMEYVTEQDSLVGAARKMRDINVGAVPVKDAQNRLSGILTDRDVVVRGIAEGKSPNDTTVKDVMTTGAISCPAEQSVEEAAKLMEKEQVRRLVVIDDNNSAVGMLALGDIAVKSPGKELAGEAVEEISKPAQPGT